MSDQANELRQLVRRAALHAPVAEKPPQVIAVASGKGGVGTTTVAVQLAMALARDGRRTVLVDADLQKADAALLCGVEEPTATVADVLSGRLNVHEALERGPAGILLLPGTWAGNNVVDCSPGAQERLVGQLKCLGAYADYVILDVGSGANRVAGHFWQAADCVLLVTTSDVVALMDAYAAVKLLCSSGAQPVLRSFVNRAGSTAVAADVHQRLSRACRRFLGLKISSAGHLGESACLQHAAGTSATEALPLEQDTARAIESLAQSLTSPPGTPTARTRKLLGRSATRRAASA